MADKESKEKDSEGGKKGSKKLILIIAAVVLLGGGGAGAYLAMRGDPGAEDSAPAPTVGELGPPALINLETFMVNVFHPDGDRHAKLKLDLAVVPASVADAVANDSILKAKLRDRVLTLLTSKTFDELRSPVGKESFRREVKARLNPLLESTEQKGAQIDEVLFSEFIVQ